ncbi:MAG: hypothetical protein EXR98_22150, partial [Gemmataceae bacterium]|nr:hypothetical protein [Gemmataceae bacterium]
MKRITPRIAYLLACLVLPWTWSTSHAQKDAAEAEAKAKLSRALTLHASFDKSLVADFSRGDKKCYVQQGKTLVAAKPNDDVKLAADAGRFGGAIHFPKKGTYRPSFKDGGVLGYNAKSWNASVSAWLTRRLVDPAISITTLRLRNVGAEFQVVRQLHRARLVITFIRGGVFDFRL